MRCILYSLLFLVVPSLLHARWATLEDANVIYDYTRLETRIHKDATYEGTYEAQLAVRKEGGREMGPVRTNYSPANTTMELLEAKTITSEGEFAVKEEHIEDKPLASSGSGFDEQRQITIAFPKVGVGSKLFYKFKGHTNHPTAPGVYSQEVIIGDEIYTTAAQYVFVSEVPLFVQLYDKEHRLELTETKEDGKYRIEIRLKSPVFTKVWDESFSHLSREQQVGFAISTTKDYGHVARTLLPKYQALLSKPLPALFKGLVDQTKGVVGAVEQLNAVTSKIGESIRYLGDWRTVDGQMIPRSMEEIVQSGFGDCKDLALVTAAILRALGFEAHIAWIWRGAHPLLLPTPAVAASLNHAIVQVRHKGKVYWIDATNWASFAQGVPEDLLGRSAVVLADAPYVESIPPGKASDESYQYDLEMTPSTALALKYRAQLQLKDRAAVPLTGQTLRYAPEVMARVLASGLVGNRNVVLSASHPLNLDSRIATDLAPKLEFEVADLLLPTSAGLAFPIEEESLKRILDVRSSERVSDLTLGTPSQLQTAYRLRAVAPVGRELKGCTIRTTWGTFERKVDYLSTGVNLQDRIELHQGLLTQTYLRSPEFEKIQKQIRDCFAVRALVFKQDRKSEIRDLAKPTKKGKRRGSVSKS